jgi:thiol-disulfide isomerase/thioredoxin
MKKLLFSLFLSVAVISGFAQGYQIKIKIKNLKNDTILLGRHFNSQLIPDDTVKLKNGEGTFSKKKELPGGMYFIFLPRKTYFDILIDKNQKFSLESDTSNFLETLKFKDSPENVIFVTYQKFLSEQGKKADELKKEREKAASDPEKIKQIDAQTAKINDDVKAYYKKTIDENPTFFFSKFLRATAQVEIPTTVTSDKDKYFYYKNHYFDDFDVSDGRLLRTPIYEGKIDYFLDKVQIQDPDTLNKSVDWLIEKSRTGKELFRYMLVHLFNKYASSQVMSAENVYVHVAEKYYIPEADWSEKKFIDDLKTKVEHKKNCLLGHQSKDIELEALPSDSVSLIPIYDQLKKITEKGLEIEKSKATDAVKNNQKVELLSNFYNDFNRPVKLSEIKAEYTILWFWTPDCSHCREETPKFYKSYMEKLQSKNVKVITIFLSKDIASWKEFTDDTKKWPDFIREHKFYGWINTWSPFDPFRANYDISSSPVLYILDKDKKIIVKRVGQDQAIEIMDDLLKNETKK